MNAFQRHSRFEEGEDLVVMKFGGTSVEDAAAIRRLIGIVEGRPSAQQVIVVSALSKVTDQLLEAGKAAAQGHLGCALAIVRSIYVRHEQLSDSVVEGSADGTLDRVLRTEFQALEDLLHEIENEGQLTLKMQDRLLGYGECFSSQLITDALRHAGLEAVYVDARNCIITDARHGQANPNWNVTNERIQESVGHQLDAGRIPVLGGFIASTLEGIPTTLGRGGSDFSAAILGAALHACRVEIWTDVDGVMTADPKLCPDARVIHKMTFDEAAELAHFGAKVLHPATLAPAMKENIPVYVLNSRRPEGTGTKIRADSNTGGEVSAITAKRNVSAVEIESLRGIDSATLDAVFAAFEQHACSVEIMSTSMGRMHLLVGPNADLPMIAAQLNGTAKVEWESQRAFVCVVGGEIRRRADVASKAFAAVADLNARVLCQTVSDRAISFLVDDSRVEETVQRLHGLFFPKGDTGRDWGGLSAAFCQAG